MQRVLGALPGIREATMMFATVWMNLEIIIVTEVSQIKTANHDIIYMCSLKEMGQVNLLTKQK